MTPAQLTKYQRLRRAEAQQSQRDTASSPKDGWLTQSGEKDHGQGSLAGLSVFQDASKMCWDGTTQLTQIICYVTLNPPLQVETWLCWPDLQTPWSFYILKGRCLDLWGRGLPAMSLRPSVTCKYRTHPLPISWLLSVF